MPDLTPIGSALLALLRDHPEEWEFAPICEGVRHTPTGILVTPSIENHVILHATNGVCSGVLSTRDEAALYAASSRVLVAFKGGHRKSHVEVLNKLLGIN